MKLYNRIDFLKLPTNTVYSRIDASSGELIKGLFTKVSGPKDGWGNDWIEVELIGPGVACIAPDDIVDGGEICDYGLNLRDTFKQFRLDYWNSRRDGLFDEKEMFVVWGKKDIELLISILQNCLPFTKEE